MSDVVVRALLFHLEGFGKAAYHLWPTDSKSDLETAFSDSFYRDVIEGEQDFKVFENDERLLAFSEVIFLDPTIRNNSPVGQIVFEFLSDICTENVLVDIPERIYDILVKTNANVVEKKTISYKTFVTKYFLPKIDAFKDSGKRNSVMFFVLGKEIEDDIRRSIMATPCIPVKPKGVLKRPSEIVDPSKHSSLSSLFEEIDERFPTDPYSTFACIEKLVTLGMMQSTLPLDLILDRAKSVLVKCDICDVCAHERSENILQYLENTALNSEDSNSLTNELKHIPFVTALPRPEYWEFSWFTYNSETESETTCEKHDCENANKMAYEFYKPEGMFEHESKHLLGCHSKIMERRCKIHLRKILGIVCPDEDIEIGDFIHLLIKQLETMQKSYHHNPSNFKIGSCVSDVYRCLDKCLRRIKESRNLTDVKALRSMPIIFVGDRFIASTAVARHLHSECKPYLYKLDDSIIWIYSDLCAVLDIKDRFLPEFLVHILNQFFEAKKREQLTDAELALCKNLLEVLTYEIKHTKGNEIPTEVLEKQIYLPDYDKMLCLSIELCFNDFDAIPKSDNMRYVHEGISKEVCKTVGVKKKKVVHLIENSEDIEDFYQAEPLLTRIKSLIEGYPLDSGVLKELLQNADDAHATEICFILDKDTYSDKNLFSKSMKPLQNPALCVYNNMPFTQNDLIGIQRLGQGSKDDDPSKIGRYGVGFNSVYNITDAPSFLTKGNVVPNKETLCFFDPLAKYIPDVSIRKPGKRIKNVQSFRRPHKAVFDGYHEDLFIADTGTMFRFPLRFEPSDIKDEPTSVSDIESLLEEFQKDLKTVLLFLRNIQKITIGEIKGGKFQETCKVQVVIDKEAKAARDSFTNKYNNLCHVYEENTNVAIDTEQYLVSYNMIIDVTTSFYSDRKTYIISQALGFKTKPDESLRKKMIQRHIKMIPVAAVAYNLQESVDPHSNVHCFLPLPVSSGLPVYVHGYFALDHENRRSLWHDKNDETCHKTMWNSQIIKNVLCQAYVNLFCVVRQLRSVKMTGFHDDGLIDRTVNSVMTVLPRTKDVQQYWKLLTKSVYQEFVFRDEPFLPCCMKKVQYETIVRLISRKFIITSLSWLSLKHPADHFPTYNSVESEDHAKFSESIINNILRKVGMRIVYIDKAVQESMQEAGVPLLDLTPRLVVDFLCSHDAALIGGCSIKTNVDVSLSSLESLENINRLLGFIFKEPEYLLNKFVKLPLILCQDNVVRCLNMDCLFVTNFTDFFPKERNVFLHKRVFAKHRQQFEKLAKHGSLNLKVFTMEDFSKLAYSSDIVRTIIGEYISWDTAKLSEDWISTFWQFFTTCVTSFESKEDESDVKKETKSNYQKETSAVLNYIQDFALVPVIHAKENKLCPPKLLHTLIDIKTFSLETQNVLQKLDIPVPHDVLWCNATASISTALKDLLGFSIPAFAHPDTVIECLFYHKQLLFMPQFSNEDAENLLRYFNDNLQVGRGNLDKLKSLRIFVSYSGEISAMSESKMACIVSPSMPTCGIKEIMKENRVLLIQKDDSLSRLMNMLQLVEENVFDIYVRFILPMHNVMSCDDFYSHVLYLAEIINQDKKLQTPNDRNIIELLKRTAFIVTLDGRKKVNELFDKGHIVFSELCKESDFLPPRLRKDGSVSALMNTLGLITELTIDLFERFGHQIADSINGNSIPMETRTQSYLLLNHLFQMSDDFFNRNQFQTLSKIPFIIPYRASERLCRIAACGIHEELAPINGTVVRQKKYICWSTSQIIPIKVHREVVRSKLHILSMPSTDHWIEHCKRVGNTLHRSLSHCPNAVERRLVTKVMEEIYRSAEYYHSNCDLKAIFKDTPLIHFPEKNMIVPASNIVLDCTAFDEIIPYVMGAPAFYGKHFQAFVKLGAHETTLVHCYSAVLSEMRHDEELLPLELSAAKRAMSKLIDVLKRQPSGKPVDIKRLSLLCTDKIIRKSNKTIVIDNSYYEIRLKRAKFSYPCVYGMDMNDDTTLCECIEKLPSSLRPHLLSEMVIEDIDLSRRVPNSDTRVTEIQQYLHSQLFQNAILRLARHGYLRQFKKEWPDVVKATIVSELQNLRVVSVRGIFTIIKMYSIETGTKCSLRMVPHTQRSKYVHMQNNTGCTEMFVEVLQRPIWKEKLHDELFKFFSKITKRSINEDLRYLLVNLLRSSNTREEVNELFEISDIIPYDSELEEDSLCPTPGTYVPKHLHRHLDNDYGVIQEYEFNFIAYLVDDPALKDNDADDCSPTYMFVRVTRRIPDTEREPLLMQEYEIDCGESEYVTVKAYLLYKFVRKEAVNMSGERDVVIYDRESNKEETSFVQEHSLKEICSEIRLELIDAWQRNKIDRRHIVLRLKLKWHPDKNPDKIQLTTKAFQYLEHCIRILERGEHVPEYEGDDEDFVDGGRDSGGSSSWWERSWRRRRESYADEDWFPRGRRAGGGGGGRGYSGDGTHGDPFEEFFSREEREPYHFYSEAIRWQEQADSDLREAGRSIQDLEVANNWICYKAHQAAEKSLKAAWYAKDANKIGIIKNSHDLDCIALGLDNELESLARQITSISGHHTRMRYPDTMYGTIPAHAYTRSNADMMTSLSRSLIAHVQSSYLR
ncbi:SACS-like protein [Mya arenaria]|uniref:SACS-like protein n=2 Tax=Mya arenaria TaxID=6604 RepID=A0ABY7F3R0_MYAAR|nr:SACS-like protein [Mya arenaria]